MQQQIDVNKLQVLTFDCYGTLIDWEEGISTALSFLFGRHGLEISTDRILNLYARYELEERSKPYQPYKLLLGNVVKSILSEFNVKATNYEKEFLSKSIRNWMPFTDTIGTLTYLKKKYKLAIISNIDNDLFEFSHSKINIPFTWVITAEDVQSYKPSLALFYRALEIIPFPKNKILHIAESNYHDIAPAKLLGLTTVWVRRQRTSKATLQSSAIPDFEIPNLETLRDIL